VHIEGFGGRGGFGRRPALIVVDMTLGFTDPESPLACDLEEPVANIQKLLEAARRAEIPVVFTTIAYRESDKLTAAAFIDKVPALLTLEAGSRWGEIDPRIAPREMEPVLNKLFASAFYGTGLPSLLAAAGVGDRNEQAHEANLYDMDAKYGDVIPTEEALKYLEEVAATHAH
jgi:maleamate amidohydrolase